MRPSQDCYDLIKSFEGCRLTAYHDPKTGAEPYTVGWGSTGPGIGPTTCWTQSQADQRLVADVCKAADLIDQHVVVSLTQGMYDALTDLLYNIGPGRAAHAGDHGRDGIITLKSGNPSTLLRKLNAGDYDGARREVLKWCSPGSAVEKGLTRRREADLVLWDTPGAAKWIG